MTDGAFSPDGGNLVLRSYFSARGYAFEDGRLGEDRAVSVPLQGQSESVTYTADGSAMMFGSEGERSEVVRVEVEGGSRTPSTGGGGGGTSSGDGEDDGDSRNGTVTGGAVAVVVIVLALLAAKRRRG